jgi:serine/threonine protein kinase
VYIAKITDFGSAVMIDDYENDVNGDNRIIGQIPFTDPKCLTDSRHYRKDLRSDIYSLGVMLWEISSCRAPFEDYMPDFRGEFRDLCLAMEIISGFRECPILPTPESYVRLYKRCWDNEPYERPNIETVIEVLKTISSRLSRILEQTMTTGNNIIIYLIIMLQKIIIYYILSTSRSQNNRKPTKTNMP